MTLQNINIDRKNLTIAGVQFPDRATLDSTAISLGSQMFEGFKPTPKLVSIYLDYSLGKIPVNQLVAVIKNAL
ncbi:MAG: antitoxin VbhA family protein [Rickettsiales bacterium]|jgi:putative transcriptional regulator|nr:antitoxin VbhA family protein [Rickettsiales bacterium]